MYVWPANCICHPDIVPFGNEYIVFADGVQYIIYHFIVASGPEEEIYWDQAVWPPLGGNSQNDQGVSMSSSGTGNQEFVLQYIYLFVCWIYDVIWNSGDNTGKDFYNDAKIYLSWIYEFQMRNLLAFKNPEELEEPIQYSPFQEQMHARLWKFHMDLIHHCSMPSAPEGEEGEGEKGKVEEIPPPSTGEKLLQLVWKAKEEGQIAETTGEESGPGRTHW